MPGDQAEHTQKEDAHTLPGRRLAVSADLGDNVGVHAARWTPLSAQFEPHSK